MALVGGHLSIYDCQNKPSQGEGRLLYGILAGSWIIAWSTQAGKVFPTGEPGGVKDRHVRWVIDLWDLIGSVSG